MPPLLLSDMPSWFMHTVALLLGLLFGSFLNVVIYRLPRGMSVVTPASHCPACDTPIKPYRNIPIISWVLMGGKAPCCGVKVSPRYMIVEVIGGVLSLAVMEVMVLSLPPTTSMIHASALYVTSFALVMGLTAAAFIDLEHMIVPDSITLGGTAIGLASFSLRDMDLFDAAVGAAVGFCIVWIPFDVLYAKLRGRTGMGMGDSKLVMLAGAWFGFSGAFLVLGAGAIQGTLVTAGLMLSGKTIEEPEAVRLEREQLREELAKLNDAERAELERELALDPLVDEPEEGWGKARIAFGPFLILAILEVLLLGPDRIVGWILLV